MASVLPLRSTRALAAICGALSAALLLAAATAPVAAAGQSGPPRPACKPTTVAAFDAVPRSASTDRLARAAICLINRRRVARGLRRLRLDPRLSRAARRHTRDMVQRRYFAHVSRTGRDIVDRLRGSGYIGGRSSWTVGENLAWGSGRRGSPRAIVRAWMRSPGHRRNMLSRSFREIGVGLVTSAPVATGGPAATYTTTFGARG